MGVLTDQIHTLLWSLNVEWRMGIQDPAQPLHEYEEAQLASWLDLNKQACISFEIQNNISAIKTKFGLA